MNSIVRRHIAIVTGGSAGIGRAICLTLADSGYDIVIFDIASTPLDLVALIEARGRSILYLVVDVSKEDQVIAATQKALSLLGEPSVLLNNAGIYPRASAVTVPYDVWQRVLDVNLGGTFLCSRTVAPIMLKGGGGAIINIASGRALRGAIEGAHYAASKAAILSLTKSLALEWAPKIRVNAVIPGVTDTAQPRQGGVSDAELYARGEKIPLKRIGEAQDIAWTVDYLVSSRAAYITGQSLCVNGGSIMQ
jgi:NAD(P)-dependent dehydrogenase (short-subunit alcohol dehydrogenase family)